MRWKRRRRLRVLIAFLVLALWVPGPVLATAQVVGGSGKGGVAEGKGGGKGKIVVKGAVASSSNFPGSAAVSGATPRPRADDQKGLEANVGSLPFTGWDLIILGGVSMVLGGTGVMLRRLSTPRAPNIDL